MLKAVHIGAELAKLTYLEGRNRHTDPAEEDAAFATLAQCGNGGVFAGSFSGESPWERHPNGDELVHVLDGKTTLTIMTAEGPERFQMSGNTMIVVPQGHWHRFKAPEGVTLMTVTPQPTEHSAAEDPRAPD